MLIRDMRAVAGVSGLSGCDDALRLRWRHSLYFSPTCSGDTFKILDFVVKQMDFCQNIKLFLSAFSSEIFKYSPAMATLALLLTYLLW